MWTIVDKNGNAKVPMVASESQGDMMVLMSRLLMVHRDSKSFQNRLPLSVVPCKLIWEWPQ